MFARQIELQGSRFRGQSKCSRSDLLHLEWDYSHCRGRIRSRPELRCKQGYCKRGNAYRDTGRNKVNSRDVLRCGVSTVGDKGHGMVGVYHLEVIISIDGLNWLETSNSFRSIRLISDVIR